MAFQYTTIYRTYRFLGTAAKKELRKTHSIQSLVLNVEMDHGAKRSQREGDKNEKKNANPEINSERM